MVDNAALVFPSEKGSGDYHDAVYAVDKLAKTAGHEVLHLPPYHCELNPIELAWVQVQGYVMKKITICPN